jgi:hypothetical protein
MNILKGIIALMLAAVAGIASATPAITFNEATGSSGFQSNQSVGWQFNVTAPVTVTGLGWFDEGANGLGREHTVGIWDSSGNLLTSILVPIGTGAGLDGQYRTVSIVPIVLGVGSGYIVGGQNFTDSGDRLAFDVAHAVNAALQFVDATFSNLNNTFERPTNFSTANNGFYGPMFSVQAEAAAPLPGTLALFGLGVLVVGLARRRSA